MLALALVASVFSERILWALGAVLVNAGPPRKADAVVVLAGDAAGNRILTGAELVREGYAPKVIASNGSLYYGRLESEIARDFAVSHGYDGSTIICVRRMNDSTNDEARIIPQMLREMGAHSYLLVTSPSHTARATRIFKSHAPDLEIHAVAAPDRAWCGGRWWTTRICRKTWYFEMSKTILEKFGF